MDLLWRLVLLLHLVQFTHAATNPPTLSFQADKANTAPTEIDETIGVLPRLNRRQFIIEYEELPENGKRLRIGYEDSKRLSMIAPFVLRDALAEIATYDPEAALESTFIVDGGVLMLVAWTYTPGSLTWGMLKEAIEVLLVFMRTRPYQVWAIVYDTQAPGSNKIGTINIGPNPPRPPRGPPSSIQRE
ncbi:MAG: hypothetical protein Q9218_007712 [Villophora microphyllina]